MQEYRLKHDDVAAISSRLRIVEALLLHAVADGDG